MLVNLSVKQGVKDCLHCKTINFAFSLNSLITLSFLMQAFAYTFPIVDVTAALLKLTEFLANLLSNNQIGRFKDMKKIAPKRIKRIDNVREHFYLI